MNKNEAKIKFQGRSERSQRWFDIDFGFIEANFSTREPGNYRKLFQSHENTQYTNTLKMFQVPIGNSKCVENFKFHNDAPMLKYFQKLLNIFCFSILASSFAGILKTQSINNISLRIEESLKSKMGNRIDFAKAILKNEKIIKGEPRVYYILRN